MSQFTYCFPLQIFDEYLETKNVIRQIEAGLSKSSLSEATYNNILREVREMRQMAKNYKDMHLLRKKGLEGRNTKHLRKNQSQNFTADFEDQLAPEFVVDPREIEKEFKKEMQLSIGKQSILFLHV